MQYKVADYIIRTEGTILDLAEAGLVGFRPFETETTGERAVMTLRTGISLKLEDFVPMQELYSFDFEMEYAKCHFCHYEGGHLFWTERNGEKSIFVRPAGSDIVFLNMGKDTEVNVTLLRFGLWLMFGLSIAPLGGIAIHSSTAVKDGYAVLCLGESGTGKSTHTRLWRENIEGTKLLNDDSPIIRMYEGRPTAFGSPWSGKTHCYVNRHFPIKAFLRLSQAPKNEIRRLSVLEAIGALLPSCPPAFAHDSSLQDCICSTLSDMISGVGVYHLDCLPDADAARLSYSTIFGK